VAQMYSALLLLGPESAAASELLLKLAQQLQDRPELSPASCVDLCFASLLAPPVAGGPGRHPVDALQLVERCTRDIQELSKEGRLLLGLIAQAMEQLLPWNNKALRYAQQIQSLTCSETELATEIAAAGHLVPRAGGHTSSSSGRETDAESSEPSGLGSLPESRDPSGVFLAAEIRDALCNISAALASRGVDHSLVLNGPIEAHIVVSRSSFLEQKLSTEDQVVLLWGSSIHFLSGTEESEDFTLSLASKFQVAAIQAAYGSAKVIVLPHWRLPCLARAGSSVEDVFSLLEELC